MISAAIGAVYASRNLHSDLLDKLLHAPMSFFDTTPLGRILNRFSRDLDVIDSNLPVFLRSWLFVIAPLLSTMVLIIYTVPIIILVLVPMSILYYGIQVLPKIKLSNLWQSCETMSEQTAHFGFTFQKLYINHARNLKRIDNMRKSPIFSHFDESIVGASSIRAYRKQDEFVAKCEKLVDESQQPFFVIVCCQRWKALEKTTHLFNDLNWIVFKSKIYVFTCTSKYVPLELFQTGGCAFGWNSLAQESSFSLHCSSYWIVKPWLLDCPE